MSAARHWGRRAGAVGAALGAVAAGAAIGLVAERRSVGRIARAATDPLATERFGALRGRPVEVMADDGTRLHVEVDGPDDAAYTVVYTHGYALNSDCWHFQRRDLADLGRQVFWDQRGHGRSARGPREHATIDQLGRDLGAVLDAVAPTGPLVLVGHSMGGMTIMALADVRPQLFGDRVVGVALLSTSPGQMAEVTLGLPKASARVLDRVAPGLVSIVERRSGLVERGRRMGTDLAHAMTKRWSFASDVPPSLVRFSAAMIASTPIEVLGDFFPAFDEHDKLAALAALNSGVETLVLVGDHDLLTPPEHSEAIVAAVPGAELVVVPDAGHLVLLEHPDLVNAHLRGLIERATRAHRDRSPRGEGPTRRRGRTRTA